MDIKKFLKEELSLKVLMDYVYITIGLVMYGFGWAVFLLPYKLVTGGLTGVASIIYYGTGIPVSWIYFTVNLILLIAALKVLGFQFMTKTIYGIVVLTLVLDVMQKAVTLDDGTLFQLLGPNDIFMSIIIGCLICGSALAIIFLHQGSTGGTDIIAAIVNKYRDISLGRILLTIDVFIISSSFFVLHDYRVVIYGLVLMALENTVLDYVMNDRRESVQFLIFSRRSKDIAHEIGTKMARGITILDGHGWYSGQEMKVLCILAKKREQVQMLSIIKRIDPNAFVSIGAVSGVYGEGFDPIKVKAMEQALEKLELKPSPNSSERR